MDSIRGAAAGGRLRQVEGTLQALEIVAAGWGHRAGFETGDEARSSPQNSVNSRTVA